MIRQKGQRELKEPANTFQVALQYYLGKLPCDRIL